MQKRTSAPYAGTRRSSGSLQAPWSRSTPTAVLSRELPTTATNAEIVASVPMPTATVVHATVEMETKEGRV